MTASLLSPEAGEFLKAGRVARLGTADAAGQPLVVPICYAFDGRHCYSAVDAKPKRRSPLHLKRVKNIRENAHVSVIVDHYAEEWSQLRYVLVQGRADLLSQGDEFTYAVDLLLDKYPQYHALNLDCRSGLVIKITPERVIQWSFAP